jgi:hypothetical protein
MNASIRFRPTTRFIVTRALWYAVVATVVILGTVALGDAGAPGLLDFLTWAALIGPALFLLFVGMLYGFGVIWPVIVSRDGITCWTVRGGKRLVQWCDIANVNAFSAYHIPMLRIGLVGSRETVTTPIYADRVRDVARFVAAHAPSENPLSNWLDRRARDA